MRNKLIGYVMRTARKAVSYSSVGYRALYFLYIRATSTSRLRRKKATEMEIQIHAADHCNLNCKGCNTFSPLVGKKFADLEILKRDLYRLSDLMGKKIGMLTISGGEPLLHP